MNCSNCGRLTSIHELVRVHAKTWNDCHCGSIEPSHKVCGNCLVGYHIPVLRPSTRKWEFGTVQSHADFSSSGKQQQQQQRQQYQYQVVFMGQKVEWVYVRDDPYEAYVQNLEDLLHVVDSPKKTLDRSFNEQQNLPLYMSNSVNGGQGCQWGTFPNGKLNVCKRFDQVWIVLMTLTLTLTALYNEKDATYLITSHISPLLLIYFGSSFHNESIYSNLLFLLLYR